MLPYVDCIVIILTTIYHLIFFRKINLTIKISSSLNADYITDKKNFYGVLCAFSSSIFLFITHAVYSVIYMLYINKDNIL